jgi:AcrR family transcriptional regulator
VSTAPPPLRGAARREQILDLAELVLESEGLEALTMRRLAEAAGMQAPSLYKHWRDKDALFDALQERALRAFATEMGDVEGGLREIGRRYRAWALAHPVLYELATRRPLSRASLAPGLEDDAARAVVEAVGGDEHRARALWAAAHGLVDLELADRFPPGADMEAAWDALTAAFA